MTFFLCSFHFVAADSPNSSRVLCRDRVLCSRGRADGTFRMFCWVGLCPSHRRGGGDRRPGWVGGEIGFFYGFLFAFLPAFYRVEQNFFFR